MYEKKMTKFQTAVALYRGGFRAKDADFIQEEYGYPDEDMAVYAHWMKIFERREANGCDPWLIFAEIDEEMED